MLSFLRRTLRRIPATAPLDRDTVASQPAVCAGCVALTARLDEFEREHTVRLAEHAAMVDQLDRLYKRISARIARENGALAGKDAESPLSLRNRLRGT